MVSISQWIHGHLPSDADLGVTPKALDDAAKDLQRLSKQADNGVVAFGYKALGTAFEFGRNIGTPFEQTSQDCDRLARQSGSTAAKFGYSAVGVFFSLGSKAFRLPHDLAMGTADFVSDPITAVSSIPAAVQQNGNAMLNGALAMANGKASSGFSQLLDGAIGDATLVMVALGLVKMSRNVATAVTELRLSPVQIAAKQTLQKILAADDAAFNDWMAAPQRGAIEIPQCMLPALNKADFIKIFRQTSVSETDLQSLSQHADANVSSAARQVLSERTNPIPEGYMPIPGGKYKGKTLSPFAMKATPVTNGEWFLGVDGKPRFVLLVEDPATRVISVADVTAQPPAFIDPRINFDAGQVVMQGSKFLLKLVDNPSVAFDAQGRLFSGLGQPVVGVTYYHAQAWVLTDASGRLMLPTDLMQEVVASNFGKRGYGTATGRLRTADGQKLVHFDEWNNGKGVTADVNDPRYPTGPFGVQSTGNVWRWMQADPAQSNPYGLRGGSWNSLNPEGLRAAFRGSFDPDYRNNFVGFSPVVLAQDSIIK